MRKEIDLHGMTSVEAEIEIDMQLFSVKNMENCHITELLIIFGKGTGTLKQCVINLIENEGYNYKMHNEGSIIVNIFNN